MVALLWADLGTSEEYHSQRENIGSYTFGKGCGGIQKVVVCMWGKGGGSM